MSNLLLKKAIKSEAHRLGFQLVGLTTPDPPPHLDVYDRWLAADHQAGMGWMATERNRQRRADPRLILPECRSILVLGMAYPPAPTEHLSPGKGQIASYAWGDDYHNLLPERLRTIVAFIETQTGDAVPNCWYTDTGPILEREMAQRAGLGWIGKNTCLINPRAGSYFLLAEILLGTELPPDEAFSKDHCGTCKRCIEACPTGCILQNRTIDARRCISYLTIEEKGPLPHDLRPQIGNWIFGCDVCQQVCPWNQRLAPSPVEKRLSAQPGRDYPTLIDELTLTPQEFNRKFKGGAVKRTKRRGYLRNVAVALGNAGDPDAVPALIEALSDPEALVRGHAAWALGQIGGQQALQALENALISENDEAVITEIRSAQTNIP
jgi:epoxyqueuosine reductase